MIRELISRIEYVEASIGRLKKALKITGVVNIKTEEVEFSSDNYYILMSLSIAIATEAGIMKHGTSRVIAWKISDIKRDDNKELIGNDLGLYLVAYVEEVEQR